MSDDPRSARALALLIALGCIWGASFLFIKVIVDETGPVEVATGRLVIGAVAIGAFVAFRRRPVRWTGNLLAKVAVLALVANIAPFALIAWGEEHIESGTASVLNSTMPIFTSVVAAAVLPEERFTAGRAAGLMLGFVGVVVLTGEDVLDITDSSVLGQFAVIGAAACYSIGGVVSRTLLRSTDPLGLSILQVTAGSVLSIPVLLAVTGGSPDYSLSAEAWLSLLALGAGATGVAYVAYLWLIDVTGSVRASLVTYIIPIVGLFLGWAVLDEGIGLNTLAGSALIIGGVAIVMRQRPPTRERPLVAQAGVAEY
jgi:drug/metabolite transporter (DMT)-like permease